jgi:hypothetical protein
MQDWCESRAERFPRLVTSQVEPALIGQKTKHANATFEAPVFGYAPHVPFTRGRGSGANRHRFQGRQRFDRWPPFLQRLHKGCQPLLGGIQHAELAGSCRSIEAPTADKCPLGPCQDIRRAADMDEGSFGEICLDESHLSSGDEDACGFRDPLGIIGQRQRGSAIVEFRIHPQKPSAYCLC